MIMTTFRRYTSISLFCFIVLTSLFIVYASAAKASLATTKGLALSPIRTEIDIAPGQSLEFMLKLTDYSDRSMTVGLDAEEFNVVDQQYDYSFDSGSDMSKWVTFDINNVQLEPEKSKLIHYTVKVPSDAEPGGKYISLFATSDVQTAPGEIRTKQRVASLLYVTVKGDVTRTGSLKSLTPPFIFDGYQPWRMAVTNNGTAHFRSNYTVSVKNIFDGHEVASRSGSALVLPHTTRAISASMPTLKYVGLYRVVYTVGLGDTSAAKREYYLVFLPKQAYFPLISLTAIAISGLSYAVWKIIRRKKSTD